MLRYATRKKLSHPMTMLRGVLLLIGCLTHMSCSGPGSATDEDTLARLDAVRERKEAQLIGYMQSIERSAKGIAEDPVMAKLFVEKRRLYGELANEDLRPSLEAKLLEVRSAIEDEYIDRYLMFHDVLFVDQGGDIFFTLRKKPDYRKNIFVGELSRTLLSKSIREKPGGGFVDFNDYQMSGEPSAFFVVPQSLDASVKGWFVLQFAINKINEMFSLEKDLGQTGEVFLVNKERAMLTDSKFFPHSTVLKKHLSQQNIHAKFAEGQGHKTVIDYRGVEALTSFKVVTILGSAWLLIAKIDKSEIVTENFRRNSNKYLLQAEEFLLSLPPQQKHAHSAFAHDVEVDMDEFRRIDDQNKHLYTHGVRSCTAVMITYPGKFSYLAHISANDKIYGGDKTDLLGIIEKRIDDFEIPRFEKNKLNVTIVSPYPQYKKNIIEELTGWGIFLSQIKMVFNASARYANVSHDLKTGDTIIQWRINNALETQYVSSSGYPSLGAVLEKILAR